MVTGKDSRIHKGVDGRLGRHAVRGSYTKVDEGTHTTGRPLRRDRVEVLVPEVFQALLDSVLDRVQSVHCKLDLVFGQLELLEDARQGFPVQRHHPVGHELRNGLQV